MSSRPNSSSPPQALLPRWANNQDLWVRSIVVNVLNNRVQPANDDIGRYLKLLFAEKKLSDDPIESVPKIEEKQASTEILSTPYGWTRSRWGTGSMQSKAGGKIDFASGVTVIFGENGSGKSGFVRVLKRAAGVRTAEDILHDVRGAARPKPSATFTVTVGASSKAVEWKNEFGFSPLNRCQHL